LILLDFTWFYLILLSFTWFYLVSSHKCTRFFITLIWALLTDVSFKGMVTVNSINVKISKSHWNNVFPFPSFQCQHSDWTQTLNLEIPRQVIYHYTTWGPCYKTFYEGIVFVHTTLCINDSFDEAAELCMLLHPH
jgi:hypothetical protein